MNDKSKTFNIKTDKESFMSYVNLLKETGKSDNLLFTK